MSLKHTLRRQITFCVQLRSTFLLQVARHVAATNCFVCTGQFLWKSFSQQQNFGAATSRTNLLGFEIVRLGAAAKFCCGDKTFHNNSPVLYTRSDLSLRRVVVTCCLECSHLKSYLQAGAGTFECADRHWWITDKRTGRKNKANRGQSTSFS